MRKRRLLATPLFCLAVVLCVSACDSQAASTTAPVTTSTAKDVSTTLLPIANATSTPSAPLNAWTELAPVEDLPPARAFHAFTYVPTSGKMLLFGGLSGAAPLGDTWAYDSAADTWSNLAPAGDAPAARTGAALVYCSASDQTLLLGGYDGQSAFADAWAYDSTANAWVDLTSADAGAPSARAFHAVVYRPSTNQLILFGGMNDSGGGATYFNDTWIGECETGTWARAAPAGSVPPSRAFASLALDPAGDRIVLFGGYDGIRSFGDTWIYDPTANTWTDASPAGEVPPARTRASLVYHPQLAKMILFGGSAAGSVFNDTWAYDPATNSWSDLEPAGGPPAGRDGQALAYDSGAGKMILFGGSSATTFFNDTWSYGR